MKPLMHPSSRYHDAVVTPSQHQPPTPPGYNKARRVISRLLLGVTAASLLSNSNVSAVISSACAIMVLKDGTMMSTKNIKWGIISVVSFVFSLSAWILGSVSFLVDEEKGYTLKILFVCGMKAMQLFWGVILGLFLYSAYSAKPTEGEKSVTGKRL
jgi:hypothetical protein